MANLADNFHSLHEQKDILILPNAWDAGSAKVIEDAGAQAIATSSAGVAWALVYLAEIGSPESRAGETIQRAARYRAAGANGLFVPGLSEPSEIKAIAPEVIMPLNVMAVLDLPLAKELKKLGVQRLSSGTGIPQTIWGRVAELAKSFIATGDQSRCSKARCPTANCKFYSPNKRSINATVHLGKLAPLCSQFSKRHAMTEKNLSFRSRKNCALLISFCGEPHSRAQHSRARSLKGRIF